MPLPKTVQTVGIDLGYRYVSTFDDGRKVENPKWLHSSLKKLAREQRILSRREKGSKNREKQRQRVAITHERIANQRKDFLQKLTSNIVRENQTIYIEDLNVQQMQKNKYVAPLICDIGLYEFRRELEYKAEWYDRRVIAIPEDYPSSKKCSVCGYIKENLGSQEYWNCPTCKTRHHRDENAAKNIRAMGESIA